MATGSSTPAASLIPKHDRWDVEPDKAHANLCDDIDNTVEDIDDHACRLPVFGPSLVSATKTSIVFLPQADHKRGEVFADAPWRRSDTEPGIHKDLETVDDVEAESKLC